MLLVGVYICDAPRFCQGRRGVRPFQSLHNLISAPLSFSLNALELKSVLFGVLLFPIATRQSSSRQGDAVTWLSSRRWSQFSLARTPLDPLQLTCNPSRWVHVTHIRCQIALLVRYEYFLSSPIPHIDDHGADRAWDGTLLNLPGRAAAFARKYRIFTDSDEQTK